MAENPNIPPFDPAILRKAMGSARQDAAGQPVSRRVQTCAKCGGKGHIKSVQMDSAGFPQVYMEPCICVQIERFKQRVGPDIYLAPSLKASPLMGRTDKNLFLQANKEDLLPHLKYVLWHKGFGFFFRLLTDLDVMDAWLSKPKESLTEGRDVVMSSSALGMGVAWSSLRDAVEDPTLLVLYIGVSTHPNRALSNALTEALRIRSWAGKPTWVISPADRHWAEGYHICWSPELNAVLTASYEMTQLSVLEAKGASARKTRRAAPQLIPGGGFVVAGSSPPVPAEAPSDPQSLAEAAPPESELSVPPPRTPLDAGLEEYEPAERTSARTPAVSSGPGPGLGSYFRRGDPGR